jgi:hypothetical protein
MSRQFRRLQRIRLKTSAARTVPADFMRRSIIVAPHRGPFVRLWARPPPWPENIIGPPRPGDNRTPVERWTDWCFLWEGHF